MTNKLNQVDRYIRLPEVLYLTALSRSQIYALIQQNKFPKQHKLGVKASAWLYSSVIAWMEEKAQATASMAEGYKSGV